MSKASIGLSLRPMRLPFCCCVSAFFGGRGPSDDSSDVRRARTSRSACDTAWLVILLEPDEEAIVGITRG